MTLWNGTYFLNWYKSKKPILEKFRAKYFAVLAGFEEGVTELVEQVFTLFVAEYTKKVSKC